MDNDNKLMAAPFWRSNRFQALVVLSIVGVLNSYGIVPTEIATMFYTVLIGHIAIRTTDRLGEKIGNGKQQ